MQLSDLLKIRFYTYLIKRNNRNPLFLLFLIFSYNMLLFLFKIDFFSKLDTFYLRCLGSLFIAFLWLLNYYCFIFQRAFFSKKPNLFFRIISSTLISYEELQDKFLLKIKNELSEHYNIILYYDNNNNLLLFDKLFSCYNSGIIFDITEESGNSDKEKHYIFEIKDINYSNNNISRLSFYFKDELKKSIKNYFDLSNDNSIKDISESEVILEIGIRYIYSIIYIFTNLIDDAFVELDKITDLLLKVDGISCKELEHVRINLDLRYILAYEKFFHINSSDDNYLLDNLDFLNKINTYMDDFLIRLDKIKRYLDKKTYGFILYTYYSIRAIIYFELYGCEKTLVLIDEWYRLDFDNYYLHHFDKAYIMANLEDYLISLRIYKRLSKTKIVDNYDIDSILSFIRHHKKGESDFPNLFCEAIILYFWGDREKALLIINNIKDSNNSLYSLIKTELLLDE